MSGNTTIIHHSLNAGEVSPRMVARQDQNKYMAACETMLNWTPLVVGGAYVRPGSLYVATTKTVVDHPIKILRPFVAHRHAAYTMEFGHQYVRFFFDGLPVGAPLELVTPYQDADLPELFCIQSIDVCYLLHGLYPVQKITRLDETTFTITAVNFNPPATQEDEPTGEELSMGTLTPGATTGLGIVFEAENTGFLASDVGRLIVAGSSRLLITVVTDGDTIQGDIIDDFPDTDPIAAEDWHFVLPPQTTVDPTNDRKEVGQVIGLEAGVAAFRATDVGKYITVYGGLIHVHIVEDSTHITGIIRSKLDDITTSDPDPTRLWAIEVPSWSTELGFPTCGCFYQERFWLCNGLTVNGSVTGDFENFAKGGNDDSAISRTISDDDIDSIVWIKGDQDLKIGTFSGVFQASPTTQSGALTPTSFKVIPIDAHGGTRVQPLRVSPVLIFVDVNRRELRQLDYDFASDKFKSQHLFRMSEHLIDGFFITETAYAASPDSAVYVVRNDGVLLQLTYEMAEGVLAWSRIETLGDIKSVCVIPRPSTGKDWIWFIVEREGGIYVEYLEPNHSDTGREWSELCTDSAVVTVPDNDGVVTGLGHLEGKTVWIIGDGQLFNSGRDENGQIVSTAVVEGGEVTIENLDPPIPISRVEVGLDVEARLVPIEPALPAEAGGPMIARGYIRIGVRIRRTLGLTLRAYRVNLEEPGDDTIAGEMLVYRKPYHAMDRPVPLQQGKKCVMNLGYDPFARIEVRQTVPFPAEVLNVIGLLHIGDQWDCETYNDFQTFTLTGFLSKECDHVCPFGQNVEVTFNGGLLPAGPAIRVTLDSGQFAFTGLVALYIPAQLKIALLLYSGESLDGIGTVLTIADQVLIAGDVLRLEADPLDETTYRVKVNDTEILEQVISDEDLETDSGCVGFVKVATVPSLPSL